MARKAVDTKTSPVTLTLYYANLSKIVCFAFKRDQIGRACTST